MSGDLFCVEIVGHWDTGLGRWYIFVYIDLHSVRCLYFMLCFPVCLYFGRGRIFCVCREYGMNREYCMVSRGGMVFSSDVSKAISSMVTFIFEVASVGR